MTHLLTRWKEQSSWTRATQKMMFGAACSVFEHLDWGALRVKQMFAAEVKRLERTRPLGTAHLLRQYPEIRHF
jgi:hypothetical protein